MKRIFLIFIACFITATAMAQIRLTATMMNRVMNAVPRNVIVKQTVTKTRKGNAISNMKASGNATYVSASAKENLKKAEAYTILAANKDMTVDYAIPLRANKDIDVLEYALERQIPFYQKMKDDYTDFSANALANYNYDLAKEYQRRVKYYEYKINEMQGMLDQIYIGKYNGDLTLSLHKPPSIKADFRFIDPITDVPIAPAHTSAELSGGYKVLIGFIDFNKIQNLPISRTITIYRNR